MFSKRFVAASAVVLTSLASVAGEPPSSLKVADPAAQVSQTTYTSVFSTYRPAAETNVSPDKIWREANARVASEGMHGGADAGNTTPSAKPDQHAGHQMAPAAKPDPHAGHQMTPAAKPDPHVGNPMTPAAKPDPDPKTGHQITPAARLDPHAGHKMPATEKATNVARPVPSKNESQPGQHQEHQEKEAEK